MFTGATRYRIWVRMLARLDSDWRTGRPAEGVELTTRCQLVRFRTLARPPLPEGVETPILDRVNPHGPLPDRLPDGLPVVHDRHHQHRPDLRGHVHRAAGAAPEPATPGRFEQPRSTRVHHHVHPAHDLLVPDAENTSNVSEDGVGEVHRGTGTGDDLGIEGFGFGPLRMARSRRGA